MRTKSILISLFVFGIACVLMPGCTKEAKEAIKTLTQKESDADKNSVFAEQTFDQEQEVVDGEILNAHKSKSAETVLAVSSDCLSVSFDLLSSPMKATLDFGTTGCLCSDGKTRQGKIFVTFNGPLTDSNSYVSSTFENYFVDNNQIIGTRVVTNKGHNSDGHLNFQIITNGSIVLANNGGTITYITDQNREWTAGENTPLDMSDDFYSLRGSSSGTTVSNQAFTLVITSPLVYSISCKQFVSGVFELKPDGEATRTLNFGNGECDAVATVTVLGFTFQITLP
jgi:hypothetical protein